MTENKYIGQLKKMVLDYFKHDNVKIILFGSRGRGDNNRQSDVDIGIMPRGVLCASKITLLRDKVERANYPYKVEIVDFRDVSPQFKEEALRGAVIWKD